MTNDHSHDEWSLTWQVITRMISDHSHYDVRHLYNFNYFVSNFKVISNVNEQPILCLIIIRMTSDHLHDDRHSNDESLEWWVTRMTSVTRSLARGVITSMMSDHSHDEWSLVWWSSLEWRVTRMMSHLNDECHSYDECHSNEEWHSHDEWWFAWCKIMYHPVYKMTIFAMVMQIHLKSMVNYPFIWKFKVKRMCSMNEWKINTMLVQLRI